MNIEIKKLLKTIYISVGATAVALAALLWFLSRAFVTIKVFPADASVLIDNSPLQVSVAGIARKNIIPGLHTVKVEADNYISTESKVDFRRGFSKQLSVVLKEIAKPLLVSEGSELLSKGDDFNDAYFLGDQGKTLYRTKVRLDENSELTAENTAITDSKLSNIEEIVWSPNKDLALFKKTGGDMNLFDFMKYDFIHQTEVLWGKGVKEVAWSPDNSKIAYSYDLGVGEKSLMFANVTNTQTTRVANLAEMGIDNPILRWSPDSEWLALIPRGSNRDENKIYLFNSYTRTFKTVTENGGQIDCVFSPDGNKILYGSYSKSPNSPVTSTLSIMDKDGGNKQALEIRAEISKVAWSKDSQTIVFAGFDEKTRHEGIYQYRMGDGAGSTLLLLDIGENYLDSIILSDDGKVLMYETAEGVFALKIN